MNLYMKICWKDLQKCKSFGTKTIDIKSRSEIYILINRDLVEFMQ